jgi:hypothetical protein
MTKRREIVLQIARLFLFVREVPHASNGGRWVEAIQRIGGTTRTNPWCAAFVSTVLGIAYQGKPPLPFTASCDVLLETARAKGWLRDTPSPGAIFLRLVNDNDADHTGFVGRDRTTPWPTIEGNAAESGTREGVGVMELYRPKGKERYVFIEYPDEATA